MKGILLSKLLLFSLPLLLVAACSSKQLKTQALIEQNSQKQATQVKASEEALPSAEKDLEVAIENELEFYSPLHIERAIQSISDSKSYQTNPPDDIKNASLMSAIAAKEYIKQAYQNKKLVEVTLSEPMEHLKLLKQLNGQEYAKEAYDDAIEQLTVLIKEIEQGNAQNASKEQSEVIDALVDAQIKTLTKSLLGLSIERLFWIEEGGNEHFSPTLYSTARKTLNSALKFIETNFRDKKEVEAICSKANQNVAKAYHIIYEAYKISQFSEEELGGYIGALYHQFSNISAALSEPQSGPVSLIELANHITPDTLDGVEKQSSQVILSEPLGQDYSFSIEYPDKTSTSSKKGSTELHGNKNNGADNVALKDNNQQASASETIASGIDVTVSHSASAELATSSNHALRSDPVGNAKNNLQHLQGFQNTNEEREPDLQSDEESFDEF